MEPRERLCSIAVPQQAIERIQTDFETETMRLTQGEGGQAVYEPVGRTLFDWRRASA